jgi:hypothetical protein
MKRRYAVILGVALGVIGSLVGFAAVARTAPQARTHGSPVAARLARDTGAGEVLLAVVGGVFPTEAEAVAANEQMVFGDVQGYYVAPVDQFPGLAKGLGKGSEGGYALVSMFRTEEGAQEFAQIAASFGYPAVLLPERVQSYGGVYAGLGQEADPQGSGPLVQPIADSLPGAESRG